MNLGIRVTVTALLCAFSSLAAAHPGVDHTASFSAGMLHPLIGWDHALAALGVSLWAVQRGGRALWAAPLLFVCTMGIAAFGAQSGFSLAFAEGGIALSVAALGLMLLAAARVPQALGFALIGAFALWHGHAHGAEMPASAQTINYIIGLVLGTGVMHLAGVALGYRFRSGGALWWRGAGVALTAGGALLLAGL